MRYLAALAIGLGWSLPYPALADAANREMVANCGVIDGAGPSPTITHDPPSFRTAAGHLNPGELRTGCLIQATNCHCA
jgi:hypothetical protein